MFKITYVLHGVENSLEFPTLALAGIAAIARNIALGLAVTIRDRNNVFLVTVSNK